MADITHNRHPTDVEMGGIGSYGEDEPPVPKAFIVGFILLGIAGWIWFEILLPSILFCLGWLPRIWWYWRSIEYRAKLQRAEPDKELLWAALRGMLFSTLIGIAVTVFGFREPWKDYFFGTIICLFLFTMFSWMQEFDGGAQNKPPVSPENRENSKAAAGAISGIAFVATVALTALYFLAISAYQGYQYLWPKIIHLVS